MGKSAKAKKEKKKDFQKVKLRVGKTKPKAANFTDTSFKARSIAVLQQSLSSTAPTSTSQFAHHLGLLNHRSENQRRESLSNLTHALQASNTANQPPPAPTSTILQKVQPLILDASTSVRNHAIKLLEQLPQAEVQSHAAGILLFIRAGMTNLSTGVRVTAAEVLEWLLNVAASEVVGAPGGWIKTLETFLILLQWAAPTGNDAVNTHAQTTTMPLLNSKAGLNTTGGFTTLQTPLQGWTNRTATAGKSTEQITLLSKTLSVLAAYLKAGLTDNRDLAAEERDAARKFFPLTHTWHHSFANTEDPYGYLDLYGKEEAADQQSTELPEDRRKAFGEKYAASIQRGLDSMKREGGQIGRGASEAEKALKSVWPGSQSR